MKDRSQIYFWSLVGTIFLIPAGLGVGIGSCHMEDARVRRNPELQVEGAIDREECETFCRYAGATLSGITYNRSEQTTECHCDVFADD